MSIEVRQMLVKSTVLQGEGLDTPGTTHEMPEEWVRIRAELLDQFQQMIADAFDERRER